MNHMEAKAVLKYSRVSPRKARLVVDLIRGRKVEEALHILKFTRRRAAKVIEKVLKSALANATNKEIGDVDVLKVSKAYVDGGPMEKRIQPTAMGRAWAIHKRMSHITIVLSPPAESSKRPADGTAKKTGTTAKAKS
jgi:large subunit ribosomal protein L22